MFFTHGFGLGWMLFGGLITLAFWVGLIVLIIFAVRALVRSGSTRPVESAGPGANRALDILKERYARGEITKDQFDSMRRDLTT
jgi:putative membrane protein